LAQNHNMTYLQTCILGLGSIVCEPLQNSSSLGNLHQIMNCIIFFGEQKSLFMIKRKVQIHCLKFYKKTIQYLKKKICFLELNS